MTTPIKVQGGAVPRGIRNNNPGNIRWGDDWQGLLPMTQRTDTSFCQFTAPEYGIRAMAKVMLKYSSYKGTPNVGKPNIDTVYEIIRRWAPPNENDTNAYIDSVARALGVKPTDSIDVAIAGTMRSLLKAVIKHENGIQPYTDQQINDGIRRAGIVV